MKGIIDSKQRKEVVESLLHQTNLWEAKDRKLGTFSGGMKQRFGIAQALIGDPKLIIVDEPTAGLDPMERNRFHNLLSEIGENVIVILSTHIVDDVSDLCNNMAIILNGEVHLVGEPIQLIKKLDGKVWKGLTEKSELTEIEKENDVISSRLYLGKVQVRIFSESPMQNGFESVTPEIEDLYFATINGLNIDGSE
jgi:ABC-type multidrug transport system ATPase subunit